MSTDLLDALKHLIDTTPGIHLEALLHRASRQQQQNLVDYLLDAMASRRSWRIQPTGRSVPAAGASAP